MHFASIQRNSQQLIPVSAHFIRFLIDSTTLSFYMAYNNTWCAGVLVLRKI